MYRKRTTATSVIHAVLIAVLLSSAYLAFGPGRARADDSSLGAVGSDVVPSENTQVRMAAERVDAAITGDRIAVTCIFTFTNSGPATHVLMGFPQLGSEMLGGEPELRDFRAFVDDTSLPVTFRSQAGPSELGDYAGWHTFAVDFAAGQTRIVRNTYGGRVTYYSNGDVAFNYILHTGATWQGTIGQADITVRWASDRDAKPGSITAQPPGYTQVGRSLRWHFTNLEPTGGDDIAMYFRPIYGPHNVAGGASASSGSVIIPPNSYGQPVALFADGNPATAWHSLGQTTGAWIAWHSTGYLETIPGLGIGILPGVASDQAAFRAHGRPKEVLVRLARLQPGAEPQYPTDPNGDYFNHPPAGIEIVEQRLALMDAPRWQFLRLAQPATLLAFRIVVTDVYPGTSYKDVAIAEVRFPLLPEDLTLTTPDLPSTGAVAEGPSLALLPHLMPCLIALAALSLLAGVRLRARHGH